MMEDSLGSSRSEAFEVPAVAASALERIEILRSQSKSFNTMELKDKFNEAFWWRTEPGSLAAEEQARQRLHALGWALHELTVWTPQSPFALHRLQVFLTTLFMSLESDRKAMKVVPQEMARKPILDGLMMLLTAMRTGIRSNYHSLNEHQWTEEVLEAGRKGEYTKLRNFINHLETEIPPDVRMAVILLTRFEPDRLARHIEERQDVFFAIYVRDALTEDALKFALLVNDVTFKFVCTFPVAHMHVAHAQEDSVKVIRELLLQVAQTALWTAWLLEFVRYPQAETVAVRAISEALIQLTSAHWSAFVDAVELSTDARTAEPVAAILVPFLHALGNEKCAEMWRLAFERWKKWDYCGDERDKHLSAPSGCAFDFPVAMHYALIPQGEALAEETELLEGIANIEQKWFTDLSGLVTHRNRLSSRLRLVQHGLTIRNSLLGGANALPPCIVPDSEFAEARYRFFDVNASGRLGR